MFNVNDLNLLAYMALLSDFANMKKTEIYELLSSEQKERFQIILKYVEENLDDEDKIDEQCKNQVIEILKTL